MNATSVMYITLRINTRTFFQFKRDGIYFNLCEITNLPNKIDDTVFTASCLDENKTGRVIVELHIGTYLIFSQFYFYT